MNNKLFFVLASILLVVSIYGGYYFATAEVCYAHAPIQELGSVVLTSEEAQELYGVDTPMLIPMNKISYYSCEKRWNLW